MNEEMLNQEEGLFDDYVDESMPTEENEKSEEIATETEEETVVDTLEEVEDTPQESVEESVEPFLNIKYDKQEIGLTKEEAKELAEKGKNYERLYDKYSNLNNSIERLARLNGMDLNTFVNELGNSTRNIEISKELDALHESYPNTEEAILRELAEKRVDERLNLQEQAFYEEQAKNADAQELEIKRQLDLFRKEYPNLEPDKLNQKVYDYVRNGYSLLEAYSKWAREEGEKNKTVEENKSKVSKLNEDNKKKSLGSTTNVEGVEYDDFLNGFLEG